VEREREFYVEQMELVKREMSTINIDQLKFQVEEKKKSMNAS
jgi:hypothetical protein